MVVIDAEVIAIVEFNLRTPGGTAHHAGADCRHGVHLVLDASVWLKARLLDPSIRPPNVRIEEEQGLVPIGHMRNSIARGEQSVEGDARYNRQCKRLPFVAGRSTRQAKGGESVEIFPNAAIKRENESMPFAVDPRKASGGKRIDTAHAVVPFLRGIRITEGYISPLSPSGTMTVKEIAPESVASMRKFHEVAFQSIVSQTQMHPSFVRIIRHNEVRRGLPAASEPTIPRLIGQAQLQRIVLMTWRPRFPICDTEPRKHV